MFPNFKYSTHRIYILLWGAKIKKKMGAPLRAPIFKISCPANVGLTFTSVCPNRRLGFQLTVILAKAEIDQ
jgi:hypothetical protein